MFPKLLIVCLLTFIKLASADDNTCPNPTSAKSYLYEGGSLSGYHKMAVGLANALHSDSLPYSTIMQLWTATDDGDSEQIKQQSIVLGKSEAGFVACFVVGLMFVFLMPLVGCCVCCCRLCDNCGGKMQQDEPSFACCTVLLIITVIMCILMATGAALFIMNSNNVKSSMNESWDIAYEQIVNLKDFIKLSLDSIVCQISDTFQTVFDIVDSILDEASYDVTHSFKSISGLDSAQSFVSGLKNLRDNLNAESKDVNDAVAAAQPLNTSIARFYNDSLGSTPHLDTNGTLLLLSMAELTAIKKVLSHVSSQTTLASNKIQSTLASTDIENKIDTINTNLSAVVTAVNDQLINAKNLLQSANVTVSEQSTELENTTAQFVDSLDSALADIRSLVNETKDFVHDPTYKMQNINLYISSLMSPIVLSVLLLVVGLLCGMVGYRPRAPSNRTIVSHQGGNCLLAAVGFMFIFSWLLMLICVLVFCFGYVLQLGCFAAFQDPTRGLYQMIEERYPIGVTVNGAEQNVSITHFYDQCADNKTLYQALQLKNFLNLTDIIDKLNNVQIPTDILDSKIQSTLPNDTWLTAGVNTELSSLVSNLSAIVSVNLSTLPSPMLQHTQAYLHNAAAVLQAHPNQTALETQLDQIRNDTNRLNTTLNTIVLDMYNVSKVFNATRSTVELALNSPMNISAIRDQVVSDAERLMDSANATITAYAAKLKHKIMYEVGYCRPIITIWNGFGDIVCKKIGYPIQGVWLGLGWCIILFIPTIIVALPLAKYLRIMRDSGVRRSPVRSGNNKDIWALPRPKTGHKGSNNGDYVVQPFEMANTRRLTRDY